jgi:hypothetical protein
MFKWIVAAILLLVLWVNHCMRVALKRPWGSWAWFFHDEGGDEWWT